MKANRTLRNAFFSDLDLPKSNPFSSCNYKPMEFLFSRALPFCHGKFGSPVYIVIAQMML